METINYQGQEVQATLVNYISGNIPTIMETINYQGQEVQATLVNYISGNIPTTTVDHDGDEDLFRDGQGRYYLRRKLSFNGRTHVHRINVNAAILWATTRLNSETLDLRNDAAALLMENRGYSDPNPLNMNSVRRKANGHALPLMATQAGDLPAEVTVPLTLPLGLYRQILAMGAYDGDAGLSETIVDDMEGDVQAWLESDSLAKKKGHPNPARFLKKFERELDAGQHPEVYPPRPAIMSSGDPVGILDARCRELMREYVAERPHLDPRDVVNAAVEFFTCDPETDDSADTSRKALVRALSRRMTAESTRAAIAIKAEPLPIAEKTSDGQRDDGCQHFTFTYPPKGKRCGLRHEIKLDAAQMELAQGLAADFGLTVRAFLKKLVGRSLPGQPGEKLEDQLKAEQVAFACSDADMARRIERAAQAAEKTVDDLVAEAIAGNVDMYEEMMIVHPKTGALLCTDRAAVFTRVDMDVTAPPRNGFSSVFSHPQREAGKQFVRFEAWLTPEELKQMSQCQPVRDKARLRYVQIPVPAGSDASLMVEGKTVSLDVEPTQAQSKPARETRPPQVNGERQTPAKPVFLLNAPRPKLPTKPKQ